MNALASASTLRPAAAARTSRAEPRSGARLHVAAMAAPRNPSPMKSLSSSPVTLSLSSSGVVVGSSLRGPALRRLSNGASTPSSSSSSPPRAARRRPRSAEAASAVTTTATAAEASPASPPPRYYASDRWRGTPKRPGKGGGEEAEEEFSSSPSSPPAFSPPREKVGIALPLFSSSVDDEPKALELPRAVESPTDDPTLANPLQRLNRMSTGWMGVIFECDGVTLPATPQLHDAAWLAVADAEGKPRPKRWQLRRADGMKGEQAVSEAFHWARAPAEVRRLARAKEEAFDAAEAKSESEAAAAAAAAVAVLLPPSSSSAPTGASSANAADGDSPSSSSSTAVAAPPASSSSPASEQQKKPKAARIFPVPGVTRFLETLAAHGVPAALASPERLERLERTLAAAGLERAFAAVVAGDDVARCRPDAEPYLLAAARLGRPPSRCVLIGNSNASVEAARDAGMAVVAVAPRSASDAASAARAAAAAAGADAEAAALAGRAAALAAEASAGGPRAYELGAADLVVRGGLDGITMADLKSLFANEAAVEGKMGGGEEGASSSSSDDDGFVDELDSRASPWSSSAAPSSSSSASSSYSGDYGGLFDDPLDFGGDDGDEDEEMEEGEDGNDGRGDADDDWRRRSRELQLRR